MACLLLATPLVLSFLLVDYFYKPELISKFLIARLFIIPISFICYKSYNYEIFRERYFRVPTMLVAFYFGVYHAYLVSITGYEDSAYYAGINLVVIVALGFLPWSFFSLIPLLLLTFGPYTAVILSSPDKLSLQILVPNFAFMISTSIICFACFVFTRRLRIEELKARVDLEDLSANQARIIEEKTKEGVLLERLSSQFSPQVVEAVKSGTLQISRTSRKELTVIFIDVQNSTQRSNRIDHREYSSLMSDFFSNCVEILLKHNVTIGTYLGDGLLAFCNAPADVPDHPMRALSACLEILAFKEKRKGYYFEKWRTDFNVRIGIESGFATIGFFPSQNQGTYTALGDCVNIASRYCGRADINSICLSKQFLKSLKSIPAELDISPLAKAIDIKGFEGEVFELYKVINRKLEIQSLNHCALCNTTMILESQHGTTGMLACPNCGYKDLIELQNDQSSAA